ncbi:MAG: serine/threonine-protein phosphatase [Elusimicrobia bacterium]|nr:serine/threonine-protein phosphatase [Elusimicrobiota bacterium]
MSKKRRFSCACLSDLGRKRSGNEDAWHADPERGLFLVADGMGGQSCGEVASRAVAEELPKALLEALAARPEADGPAVEQALRAAIAACSASLRERSRQDPRLRGMGSTVVLALFHGPCATIAHLGDSRAYLMDKGRLQRLTRDHNLASLLLDLKKITPEEAADHPGRHRLTRHVGMETTAVADVRTLRCKGAGRLLLCSDGLSGMLPDQRIAELLRENPDPESACRGLVAAANKAGGEDNITVLVADWSPAGKAAA